MGGTSYPVFLGTVLSVTDLPRTANFVFLNQRSARIRIDEPFGGVHSNTRELEVRTGAGGGDCGILFKPGETYLIAASYGDDGLLRASICSSTRKLEDAAVALRVLRQQRDHQPVPSLTGRIAQHNRNFDGNLGTATPKPLANTLVRVKTDTNSYQTRADNEGIYAFYNLPPGKYEFSPDLPPGTTLSWFIGSDEPHFPFDLEGGCQESDIEVSPSASIQGRVFDPSMKLLPYARVYIVPVNDKVPSINSYSESQSKEGCFKFVHLPPGNYQILVNPDDSQSPDFPYPKTFYPGVVTIHGGEQIENIDIHLEQQFIPRHLTVRVTWADGLLIKNFVYVQATGTLNPDAKSDTTHPDGKAGLVDLAIHPNERYGVEATLTCRYADEHSIGPGATLRTNKIYITPGDDQTELELAFPVTACPEIQGKSLLTER